MQVIVGANGYLGSYIVKNILEKTTDNIIAPCRDAENAFTDDPRVKWVSCDIENEKDRLSLASLIKSQQERCYVASCGVPPPDAFSKNRKKRTTLTSDSWTKFCLRHKRSLSFLSLDRQRLRQQREPTSL